MTLYEKAREVADDYSKKLLRKRWQSHLLAAKLLDLRDRNHWTQAEVATRAGISESAVRNYEQQKSTPKQGHLEALARAFGIRPEALRLYDIDSMPLNAMVQIGETYGLEPAYDERFAYLRPTNDIMSNALYKWAVQYRALKEEVIDRDWYEEWKDKFYVEYSERDFPLRYRSTPEGTEPLGLGRTSSSLMLSSVFGRSMASRRTILPLLLGRRNQLFAATSKRSAFHRIPNLLFWRMFSALLKVL